MSKSELATLWYEFRKDPMGYAPIPASTTISPETLKEYREIFTKIVEGENNPIELE